MKKLINQYAFTLVLLGTLLIHTALPVMAAGKIENVTSKEEVVYALLNTEGALKEIYTVNILNVTKDGTVSDYGKYASVKNLTNTNDINYNSGRVTVDADEGLFYYQGQLKNSPLPWDFSMFYTLDGKRILGEKLAGKEGQLEITIKTVQNKKVNAVFYKNYLLQVSVTLDGENCKNINAHSGTIANAGDNKMITFTVMPGKDGYMTITSDVTDFQMKGISFSAVPFSMDMELPDTADMTDDMTELADAIRELNDGVQGLDEGVIQLKDGVIELNDGFDELYDGVAELNDGAEALKQGSAELNDGGYELREGITAYKAGLNAFSDGSADLVNGSSAILSALQLMNASIPVGGVDLSAMTQLPAALSDMADGLTNISAAITGYGTALTTLKTKLDVIPEPSVSEIELDELRALVSANAGNSDALNSLIANYNAAQDVKATYAGVSDVFENEETKPDVLSASIHTMAALLTTMGTQVSESLANITGVTQLTQGLTELVGQYTAFHQGLVAYISGFDTLSTSLKDIKQGIWDFTGGVTALYEGLEAFVIDGTNTFAGEMPEFGNGLSKLTDGVDELADGVGDLAEGTQEMRDNTKGMPDEIQKSIEDITNNYTASDFTPVSFVSDENKDVESVQFIMTSESIEIQEPDEKTIQEEEKETLITRFIDLFKKKED